MLSAGPALAQRAPKGTPPAPAPAPPPPPTAGELAAQGLEQYRAGNFAAAVDPLQQAHTLEPGNFDIRYGLAQALRQAGKCEDALPHYRALVDAAPDPATAKEVRSNMEQCPGGKPPEPPPAPAPPPPPPERVVVERGGASNADMALLGGAGASLGLGVGLFMAARWSSHDADVARSYDDHESLSNRATVLYVTSFIAAGAAIGLGAFAVYRFKSSKESSTSVSLTPRTDGGAVVIGGTW